MIRTGRSEILGEKCVPVPLCPLQIPCGLAWDQGCVSTVRGICVSVKFYSSSMNINFHVLSSLYCMQLHVVTDIIVHYFAVCSLFNRQIYCVCMYIYICISLIQ